ncbi:trihelix transcription factor GTL1 isoform X1 [Prunus yedoensis var. nudiflora]|uniref:Trihelix transcription factor GTL1 isoform X1 n=1 Tax=Prunus yedoensis var. nudiflora TaxID=2094558 RepID=A0A314XKF5_PRUYE|nr:trihelix transcription factor GTL1 isoform X1 [Prunus yedoensis var. nudiflora]
MQQGAGGTQTHYGVGAAEDMGAAAAAAGPSSSSMAAAAAEAGDQAQLVEAASPISSRPPASASVNLDELMTLSGAAAAAEDALAGSRDEADRGGGSEMDVSFRDATLKGPLWEDVSRKLAELGYKRSAKKCKEKFENVHKYYKRTKEGRAGRQDGKSYKFFSELEALHGTTAATSSVNVSASPAVHVTHASLTRNALLPRHRQRNNGHSNGHKLFLQQLVFVPGPTTRTTMMTWKESLRVERKRGGASTSSSGSGSTRKMMEFFEVLMKQVMHKQETMQQRFLEVIEKREQDRTIREEAWKRQEMVRLTREHELMSQERAISASRDAAIIAFLQKITGQTIQLPPPINVHAAPPPPVPPSVPVVTPLAQQSVQPPIQTLYHQTTQQQQQPPQQQHVQQVRHHQQQSQNLQVVMAVPEQQVPPPQDNISSGGGAGGSLEPASSSRWPKAEVLALIKLRSGLESRYQEAGPKGPLWEEISAGMGRMGYKRSSKRCKEKWENINKYFKKVKESNKQRPEDAKTCPYFHELDALYRKRILGGGGGGGSSSSLGNQNRPEQPQQQQLQLENPKSDSATQPQDRSLQAQPSVPEMSQTQEAVVATDQSENKNGDHGANVETSNVGLRANLFGEATDEAAKKPEDIVKELMQQQQQVHDHLQQGVQTLVVDDYDRIEEADSDNIMDQDEDMEDDDIDEEDDEEMEEESKMAYKIEFQKQNTTGPSSNGGGNGAPSFLAMVQ